MIGFATFAVAAALASGAPPAQLPAASAAKPAFEGKVTRIEGKVRDRIEGSSWRPGCPVGLNRLRLLDLTYVGFDRETHRGRLVVHANHAKAIVSVFKRLYSIGYPIRRMELVDRYGADDRRSMAHDNTSAFNCRFVAGTERWSNHAYGLAVDINPIENPYVSGSHVSPPEGRRYADRSRDARGMIHAGDAVVKAFARRAGWEWLGDGPGTARDYQHFSADGT
jgi:hypothetical protein